MELTAQLVHAQGKDGGWGYRAGASAWTEPTALALLAIAADGEAGEAVRRGWAWLAGTQRPDGGWPPNRIVAESTWVTSLAVMALARLISLTGAREKGNANAQLQRGAGWLIRCAGRQESTLDSFRAWLFRQPHDPVSPGWSWCPGTASWVIPTAMGILALESTPQAASPSRGRRIGEAREFLLARQCAGGGWNHGGSFLRSENSRAYPETTGIALLALRGIRRERLAPSLHIAEAMLSAPESSQGVNWLRLGLAAQGCRPEWKSSPRRCWTVTDLALERIAAMRVNPLLTAGAENYQ